MDEPAEDIVAAAAVLTELDEGVELLHNDQTHSLYNIYYSSLQSLCQLYNIDDDGLYTVQLTGDGFDGMPMFYSTTADDTTVKLTHKHPVNNALYVCDGVVTVTDTDSVLFNKAVDENMNVLYLVDGAQNGTVRLQISSATMSKQTPASRYDFSQTAVAVTSGDSMASFYIDGTLAQKQLENSLINFPCVKCEPYNIDGSNNSNSSNIVHLTYAIKQTIAFSSMEWPEQAFEWLNRKRPSRWPSRVVITQIMNSGVHIVPSASLNENTDSVSLTPRKPKPQVDWELCFVSAEKILISKLGRNHMKGFVLFESLLDMSELYQDWFTSYHTKYILFYTLEELDDKDVSVITPVQLVHQMMTTFTRYLQDNLFPHYFLPTVNLLDKVDESVLENLNDFITSLIQNQSDFIEICSKTIYRQIVECVSAESFREQVCINLKSCFDRVVKLWYLRMYTKSHDSDDVDILLTKHKEALAAIVKNNQLTERAKPMSLFISNSLGNLLVKKAMGMKAGEEREHILQKAQENLLRSSCMDKTAGRVRLANFFYMTNRANECVSVLKDVLSSISNIPVPQAVSVESFERSLWADWCSRNYNLDLLVSQEERCTVPKVVGRNLSLAYSQILGLQAFPVAHLSPITYAYVLLSLSYGYIGFIEESIEALEELESLLDIDQEDMNEKRNVAFHNMAAYCYIKLGEKESGVRLLRKSLEIMANPRNPARWSLLKIQTEKSRVAVVGGLGAAAVLGTAIAIVAFIKNKF